MLPRLLVALPLRLLELELELRVLVPSLRLLELGWVVALLRLLELPRDVVVLLERLLLFLSLSLVLVVRLEEVLVPRPLLSELTPLRLLVLLPRLLLLSELTPLRLLVLSPRDTSPVRLGAGVVLRLPLARSVVVMVLSPRLLVMRLPLRRVGSFCTGT